jgi:MerR family transcriptional regulator, redox-sensitive transcriptional activator SoxR
MSEPWILIGELARRAGVAASALRFYEAQGLLDSTRSEGAQRQFPRSALRRVAFIRAAQAVGLSLDDIKAALASLPHARTPTQADWQRLSRAWQPVLDARIAALVTLRDQLSACIGCGCLSLQKCKLYNPHDVAATRGNGPRYWLGDSAAAIMAKSPSLPATRAKPANRRQTDPGRI